jgi:SAM-dependent methyltransferase
VGGAHETGSEDPLGDGRAGHPAPAGRFELDELAHAGPEHLDPDFVATYDRKQNYDPTTDVEALIARGLGPSSTLLDMGCGTGTFSVAVAPHCHRVIAVDVSRPMLDRLGARADSAGLDNIELVQAGFLSYEHRGAPVEVAYSRNALHHLPDFWKVLALRRLAGAMTSGALLWLQDLVYAFEPSEVDEVFDGWFDAAVDDPADGYTSDDLATHVRSEFSTYTWLLEPMLAKAGFEVLDVDIDRRRTYARYACVKRRVRRVLCARPGGRPD